jgi:hypothetical protein
MMNYFRLRVATTMIVAVTMIGGNVQGLTQQSSDRRRQLQKKVLENHEQMMAVQSMPDEIDVDPRFTYNEKFMALMDSPCRPEQDGFFGATSGDPVRVQFGFQLEIEPLADIMEILDVIEDKVVDSILMNTFPNMCGLQRRRELSTGNKNEDSSIKDESSSSVTTRNHVDGHPSGFRFMKFEEAGTSFFGIMGNLCNEIYIYIYNITCDETYIHCVLFSLL